MATVVGQCIAAVAALILNLKKNPDIHIRPRHIRWHGATVKNIYRIGLPSIVMQCIGSVMVFGVNRILISSPPPPQRCSGRISSSRASSSCQYTDDCDRP